MILAGVFLFVSIRLFLRWIFATLLCVYEDLRPRQALRASQKMAKGRIKLNIELKLTGHEKNLVKSVLKIIEDRGFKTSCFISSLDAEVLRKVRQLDSSMRLGQIVFRALGELTRVEKEILCLHTGIATRSTIVSAQKNGKEVHVWTVNNPQRMAHFMDLGVDNILNDIPDVLVALREERKKMTEVERFLLAARLWF